MTLDLMKQKIKGHFYSCFRSGRGVFCCVAVGLRHVFLNKRSDDDVVDAAVFDLDAVFDHLLVVGPLGCLAVRAVGPTEIVFGISRSRAANRLVTGLAVKGECRSQDP